MNSSLFVVVFFVGYVWNSFCVPLVTLISGFGKQSMKKTWFKLHEIEVVAEIAAEVVAEVEMEGG